MEFVVGHSIAHQIVFAGPFGVGKTTALRLASDIGVVDTDVASREVSAGDIAQGKTTTTTGFDYGERWLPDGSCASLIGVPGQDRFEAMWDATIPNCTAVVLWVFGDRDPELADCAKWLDMLAERKIVARLTVAVTRANGNETAVLNAYRELASRYHPAACVAAADPRGLDDVLRIITNTIASPMGPIGRR